MPQSKNAPVALSPIVRDNKRKAKKRKLGQKELEEPRASLIISLYSALSPILAACLAMVKKALCKALLYRISVGMLQLTNSFTRPIAEAPEQHGEQQVFQGNLRLNSILRTWENTKETSSKLKMKVLIALIGCW